MASDDIEVYSLIIRDGDSGEVLCDNSLHERCDQVEDQCVEIPVRVLNCTAVSREITFHSKKQISNLSIVQRVMIQQSISTHGDGDRQGARWACLEEWVFTFGFVIPGSINSWQSVVTSAKDENGNVATASSSMDMIGAEFVIETNFYDDKAFLCKKSVRVRYI